MGPCPRCGTRLLPGALACINCELPIPPAGTDPPPQAPAEGSPTPYGAPSQPYSPYSPNPGNWPPYGAAPHGASPQPGMPYGGPPGPTPWSNNGLAIASLVLSILWLGGLGSLLAVIFGHVSRGQIRRRPQRGAGVALAGLIIGYVGLVGSVVVWANLENIINSNVVQNELVKQDMKDAAQAERAFFEDNGSFTVSGVDLQNHGFQSVGDNTIYAGAASSVGYCLVGAHNDTTTWYLYDSRSGGLSATTYVSAPAAEAACSVTGVSDFVAIA
jgi:hypothetical protein